MPPYAVITTTGTDASTALTARSTPSPSPAGSRRSVMTTSGCRAASAQLGVGLIAGLDHGMAVRLERQAQHRPQRVAVLDHEHDGAARRGLAAQRARA